MGKYHPHGDTRDLRRHGAHGAGLLHAPAADRRAGQFRLDGRRSAGGHALHRGAAGAAPPRRCSPTSTRTRSISSRTTTRREQEPTVLPAGFPNLLVNGARRHRRRHGDQHPAAQSRRGHRRLLRADRQSRAHHRRADGASCRGRTSRPAASSSAATASAPAYRDRPRLARSCAPRRRSRRSAADREAIIVTEMPYQVNKARLHRAHRRGGAREAGRGHRRAARRERPRRRARRHRAEARRRWPTSC